MQTTKTMLLVGATSDIGHATALHYAQGGWRILLAARDAEGARRNADDIAARTGVEVSVHAFDVLETERFAGFIDGLPVLPQTVVCVVDELGEQARAETDIGHAAHACSPSSRGRRSSSTPSRNALPREARAPSSV